MDGERTLLVAATGGHLEQLFRISRRIVPASSAVQWVTHRDAQSESLLGEESVHYVPYVPPRGYRQIAALLPDARRTLKRGGFDRVISTGAGIAIPYLITARARGLPCHYIESAARADGPSLTGRIVSKVPGVRLYTQYQSWAGKRWSYRGSLFDSFAVEEVPDEPVNRVVVTLGTMRTYEFGRLVQRLNSILPNVLAPGAEVLWQVGVTRAQPDFGRVEARVPGAELRQAISDADLVVAHSGIGSAITALEMGKRPLLVPRRVSYGEHVDNHQELIARELGKRGLAIEVEADRVTEADLLRAARGRVGASTELGPFSLK